MIALAGLESASSADLARQIELTKNLNWLHGSMFAKTLNVETENHPSMGILKKVSAMLVTDKPDHAEKTFIRCDYDYQE